MCAEIASLFAEKISLETIRQHLEAVSWNKIAAMQRIDSSIPKNSKTEFDGKQVIAFNHLRANNINFINTYKTIVVTIVEKKS